MYSDLDVSVLKGKTLVSVDYNGGNDESVGFCKM